MKNKLLKQLKQSFECAGNLHDFIFHIGYSGIEVPRILRCMLARSTFHQAWMSGFYGGGILSVLERHSDEFNISLHDLNVNSYNAAYELGYLSVNSFSSQSCPPSNSEEWFVNAWQQGRSDACYNTSFN